MKVCICKKAQSNCFYNGVLESSCLYHNPNGPDEAAIFVTYVADDGGLALPLRIDVDLDDYLDLGEN